MEVVMYSIGKFNPKEETQVVRLIERTFCEVVDGRAMGRPAKLSALREEILNIYDYDLDPSVTQSMTGLEGFLASYQ